MLEYLSFTPTMRFRWLQYKNNPTMDEIKHLANQKCYTLEQAKRELANATVPKLQQLMLKDGVEEIWIDIPLVMEPHKTVDN